MPRTAVHAADPREARLPVWARTEIERLRQGLAYAQASLAEGPENSNTFADPHGDERPLGDSPTVRLWLVEPGEREANHSEWIDVRVSVDHHGRRYVQARAGRQLMIEPQSSNVVRLHNVRT